MSCWQLLTCDSPAGILHFQSDSGWPETLVTPVMFLTSPAVGNMPKVSWHADASVSGKLLIRNKAAGHCKDC